MAPVSSDDLRRRAGRTKDIAPARFACRFRRCDSLRSSLHRRFGFVEDLVNVGCCGCSDAFDGLEVFDRR
jgi:hypothetical protein